MALDPLTSSNSDTTQNMYLKIHIFNNIYIYNRYAPILFNGIYVI